MQIVHQNGQFSLEEASVDIGDLHDQIRNLREQVKSLESINQMMEKEHVKEVESLEHQQAMLKKMYKEWIDNYER